MLGLMQDRQLLVSGLLRHAESYHPDVEIISKTCEGAVVRSSYRQLGARVRRLARALTALGVQPGDRVATLAWNTHRHLELYFAVSGIGAVLHTVNPRLFPSRSTISSTTAARSASSSTSPSGISWPRSAPASPRLKPLSP